MACIDCLELVAGCKHPTTAECTTYTGSTLACTGIATNDTLDVALVKIDTKICTSISLPAISSSTNGKVLSNDGTLPLWISAAGTVTLINTSSPLQGGPITASGTISIKNAQADGATKGAATFDPIFFSDNNAGLISLADAGITLAKIQSIPTNSLIGRSSAGTGVSQIITVGSGLTLSGGILTSAAGTGTVSSFSFSDGGGFTGVVTNSTTTPALSLTLRDAIADGSTKGQCTFTAADFNTTSGVVSIDYTNGQAASGSTKGFLTAADWTTFNNKGSVSSVGVSSTDLSVSGSPITTSGSITLNINSAAVSYAKIQNVAASRLLGNPTGGATSVSEISLSTGLAFSGTSVIVSPDTTNQQVNILKNGSSVGTRKSINFIEGANTTFTITDNSGSNRIDLTIDSAGGGGGGTPGGSNTQLQYNNAGNFGGTSGGVYSASGNLFSFVAQNATDIPLTVQGTTSQSGNLTNWKNQAGTVIASVSAAGNITGTNLSGTNTGDQTITLTSDITGSGTGSFATTIANNAVSNAKFRQSAGLSVVGNATNATANVADITAANDGEVLRRSGTTIGFGTIATAGIANDAITYAKIQNVVANRLLGRYTASTGDIQEVTVGSGLNLDTSTGILTATGTGTGTVTSVSVVTANGVSGSVANATTTPAITLTLGAITPSTVNGLILLAQAVGFTIAGGTISRTLTVAANANVAGTNTGDVTKSGENYLTLVGQALTANAVNLSGTNVTGTLAAARFPALTGDVTNTVGTLTTTIANDAVTYAKLQNVTGQRLLGRYDSATGNAQEITVGSGLSLDNSTGILTTTSSSSCFDTLSSFVNNVNSTVNSSTTTYTSLSAGTFNNTLTNRMAVIPSSGVLKNLFVLVSGNQPNNGNCIITLMKGTTVAGIAATSLQVTLPISTAGGTGTVFSDTSNTVSVNAGDIVALRVINNSSTAASINVNSISLLFTNS